MAGLISIFLLVALTVVLIGIIGSYWLEKRLSGDQDDPAAVAGAGDAWR